MIPADEKKEKEAFANRVAAVDGAWRKRVATGTGGYQKRVKNLHAALTEIDAKVAALNKERLAEQPTLDVEALNRKHLKSLMEDYAEFLRPAPVPEPFVPPRLTFLQWVWYWLFRKWYEKWYPPPPPPPPEPVIPPVRDGQLGALDEWAACLAEDSEALEAARREAAAFFESCVKQQGDAANWATQSVEISKDCGVKQNDFKPLETDAAALAAGVDALKIEFAGLEKMTPTPENGGDGERAEP